MDTGKIRRRKSLDSVRVVGWMTYAVTFFSLFAPTTRASEHPEAPKVTNVHFTVASGEVLINYDLLGEADAQYSVQVELRDANDSAYRYFPRSVAGDAGVGRFAGLHRRILWPIRNEFPLGLPDSSYYFVINVRPVQEISSRNTYYLIGGAAALLTAATTYFLINGAGAKSAPVTGLPAPPGRP